jgi:aminoglycoside phosphotransferase (APT) family kinase protein
MDKWEQQWVSFKEALEEYGEAERFYWTLICDACRGEPLQKARDEVNRSKQQVLKMYTDALAALKAIDAINRKL